MVFPMRYNAKSLEINVVISGNVILFKDIKISLGLLISAPEMHARENHFLEVSSTANNRITVSTVERKNFKQILVLIILLIYK